MERMVKNGINVLYSKSVWNKNGKTTKSFISNFLILVITLVSLIVFIYLVSKSTNKNMNLIYAIVIVAIQKALTDIVEKIVYGSTLSTYKLIRWIYKLYDVDLKCINQKLFIIHKSKIGFKSKTNFESLLRKLRCKYEISYIKKEHNGPLVVHIDTVCFKYVKVDIVD